MSFPSITDYPFYVFQKLVRNKLSKEFIVKKVHHDTFLAELTRLNPSTKATGGIKRFFQSTKLTITTVVTPIDHVIDPIKKLGQDTVILIVKNSVSLIETARNF